ncbi:MAG: TIGR01777 family oxidoreductase [Thermodesulfobacteriota bacterium]|nr:TIGR01777 family oxidoreductase [Thermodesulfobacteriota bacterium]
MRVIVTGGTGFIGKALCGLLVSRGHEVVVASRSEDRVREIFSDSVIPGLWDGKSAEGLVRLFEASDRETGVVNLVGESIAVGRWTLGKKERILKSRVDSGQAVAEAALKAEKKPRVVVQASAVGYYGDGGDTLLDESSPLGSGFLAGVCRAWEDSTQAIEVAGVRRVIIRTGVVLGPHGGALEKFLPPFRMFMGGPLGSGKQWFPWIHLADEVGAIVFLLENKDAFGAFNLTSPGLLTMRSFCAELGRALKRPSWFPVPGFALRLVLGAEKASEMILSGQRAYPKKLLEKGYEFLFSDLAEGLKDVIII